jgi:hypothetical protein
MLLLMTCAVPLKATHTLGYFVYHDTVYWQGPWHGYDSIDRYNGRFLMATYFEDLFGSVEEERAETYLSRLRQLKPDAFAWKYTLQYSNDTLHIWVAADTMPGSYEIPMLAATFLKNGFRNTLVHNQHGTVKHLTESDITLPFFDLLMPAVIEANSPQAAESETMNVNPPNQPTDNRNYVVMILVVSLVGNALLMWKVLKGK